MRMLTNDGYEMHDLAAVLRSLPMCTRHILKAGWDSGKM